MGRDRTDDVHLVARDEVPAVAAALRDAPLVAVDTEFHAERRYRPELLLVQVHVPGGPTWLLDPLTSGVLPGLAEALLAVPTWLVHAGHHDLRLLHAALGGLPGRVWDTQLVAGLVEPRWPSGLAGLTLRHLGVELDKGPQMSDWSQRPLSSKQLAYAAADVRWLPPLADALQQRLEALGRADIARQVLDEALEDARRDDPLPAALRRAAGQADLSPRDRAVLRELVAWREQTARAQDRPPGYVLGDGMLRDLARHPPQGVGDLQAHRRVSDRTASKHGRAILAAIARGAAVPEATLPPVVRKGTPEERCADWLEVLAAVAGVANAFAPRLALPRERVEELALLNAPTREAVAQVLGSWRDGLVGPIVHEALSGGVSLRLDGGDVSLTRVSPILRKSEPS